MTRKYDWDQLYNEFVVSDIQEVAEFLRQKLGVETSQSNSISIATKGWGKEKIAIRKAVHEQVLSEQKDKLLDRERQTVEMAAAGENLVVWAAYEKVKKDIEDYKSGKSGYIKLTAIALKELFNIFRIEQGKSLGTVNQNITTTNTKDVGRNIIDAESLQEKLKELIDDPVIEPTAKEPQKEDTPTPE